MSLSRYEMETIINFNREEDTAELYTADSVWMNKMDKIIEKNPAEFKLKDIQYCGGKIVSKTYAFPKRYITIRTRTKHMCYSDEEIAKRTERIRNTHTGVLNKDMEASEYDA